MALYHIYMYILGAYYILAKGDNNPDKSPEGSPKDPPGPESPGGPGPEGPGGPGGDNSPYHEPQDRKRKRAIDHHNFMNVYLLGPEGPGGDDSPHHEPQDRRRRRGIDQSSMHENLLGPGSDLGPGIGQADLDNIELKIGISQEERYLREREKNHAKDNQKRERDGIPPRKYIPQDETTEQGRIRRKARHREWVQKQKEKKNRKKISN